MDMDKTPSLNGILPFMHQLRGQNGGIERKKFPENAPCEFRDGNRVFLSSLPNAAKALDVSHRGRPYYNRLLKADIGQFSCSSAAGQFTLYGNIRQSSVLGDPMRRLLARQSIIPLAYELSEKQLSDKHLIKFHCDPHVWKFNYAPIDPANAHTLESIALLQDFIDNDDDHNWYAGYARYMPIHIKKNNRGLQFGKILHITDDVFSHEILANWTLPPSDQCRSDA